MNNAAEIIAEIETLLPPPLWNPWESDLALLREGSLVEATTRSLSVEGSLGCTTVEYPGGLTEKHYEVFSPELDEQEVSVLAMAVLESLVGPVSWQEWEVAKSNLAQSLGNDYDELLPKVIQAKGFAFVVSLLKRYLGEHRKTYRPSRISVAVVKTPRWYMKDRLLVFGGMRKHFRDDAENILTLLNELEKNRWEPICLSDPRDQGEPGKTYIDSEQVRDAAKALRKRTKPDLNWYAGDDGTLGWLVP